MEANAVGVSVRFRTLSQALWVMSLCVPSECASVFLSPQHGLDTLSVAQTLSAGVLVQQQPVAGFCPRVTA